MKLENLKGHVPDSVLLEIPGVMEKFAINTTLRLAHFLAQCSHESGGFKALNENLNYSKDGLLKTFPKYFTAKLAESYARKPDLIGSRIYANRMGNGDEKSHEGFNFHGRGYIQLTGKENYTAFGKAINEDVVTHPNLVAEKYPLLSAAWFFSKNGINAISDKGATDVVVESVTRRVNGGTIGLDDRKAKFVLFYGLLK